MTRLFPNAGYYARVLLSVSLSLFAAYWLQLDSPYSAATTTLIVVSASRGAILSKSLWRIGGTLVGATAAVVMVAAFAQAPVLFVLTLAVWLGLCTALSSLLRYFRSYGAVLAGYTVTLVAFGALDRPENVFGLAAARLAVVVIGVVSPALVFLLTDRGPGPAALEERVASEVSGTARLLQAALLGGDPVTLVAQRSRAAASLAALDQAVEFAAVEDAGLARFAGELRLAAAELFAALTGGLRAAVVLRRRDDDTAEVLAGLMARLADLPAADPAADALRRDLLGARGQLVARAAADRTLAGASASMQAIELLDQFGAVLDTLAALRSGRPRRRARRLRVYVNPVTALRNGLRAAIAVGLAGLFWIESAWPSGGGMLGLLGPVCGLLAQSDSAAAASLDFLKGIALAALAAFVLDFVVLPQMTGFPLLLLGLLPFVLAGVAGTLRPRTATVATAYLIFVVTLAGPSNPMRFQLAAFLNTAFAFIVGAGCAVFAFRVLLPSDPVREAQVLERSLRAAVGRVAAGRRAPVPLVWEHLQHQKLTRLSRRLAADPGRRLGALRQGEVMTLVGRRIAQLRALPPGEAALVGTPLRVARLVLTRPGIVAAAAEKAASALLEADPAPAGQGVGPGRLHVAALLHELSDLLVEHGDDLAGRSGARRPWSRTAMPAAMA